MTVKSSYRTGLGDKPGRRAGWIVRASVLAVFCAPLIGCGTGGMEDLRSYTEEVLKRKSKKIDPIPTPEAYVAYTYKGVGSDPFVPFVDGDQMDEEVAGEPGVGGPQPDLNRIKEELEAYPLDSLRMVGTLDQAEDSWGIVLNREGTIYRVKVGNYMGQNHGKIIAILEDRIELTEIARDSQGRWQEREASLALVE